MDVLSVCLLAAVVAAGAPAPPTVTDGEVIGRVTALERAADGPTRAGAALALAALPGRHVAALGQRLERELVTRPDVFRRLFLQIWAQVPNWKSGDPMWIRRPEPAWVPPPRIKGQPRPRRPPPHDPEATDWLTALAELDLAAPELLLPSPLGTPPDPPTPARKGAEPPAPPPLPTPEELARARAEALEVVAILRALGASGLAEAVEPIFTLAFRVDGVFRDECGRQLRALGDAAVAPLILKMHGKGPAKQRRYAAYQLDRMDRARPQKAISAASDDRLRAAILHAYGEVRAIDAVDVVLDQLDAAAHRVRREARWAWSRYVSGPAPPPAPKRHRKLPGGKEESEEKPDYLTYRELAELAVRKRLSEVTEAPVTDKGSAEALSERLLALYDARRSSEWDQQLEVGLALDREGKAEEALATFRQILAHEPTYARREAMVPLFYARAEAARRSGRRDEAISLYRQARALAPEGPQARAAAARAALLEGLRGLREGTPDPAVFREALTLDPSLGEARDGLAQAEARLATGRSAQNGAVLGGACLVLFALWLFGRRVGPPPATPTDGAPAG